jgi:hypothetical protein
VSAKNTPHSQIASQILTQLGLGPSPAGRGAGVAAEAAVTAVDRALRACARDQLLAFARQLGITGVAKLAKDPLVGRVGSALRPTPPASVPASPTAATEDRATQAANGPLRAKFDLGPDVDDGGPPPNIPWSYGIDRVTAMAVDPRRLYVYWEVTDSAIAAARKNLGARGVDAWLNLRVYDITGRLFDGTNAHSYSDERIGRDVRQWFFEIGKPSSMACVEVGLKSPEGYFVKIARSGRVEFAREAPQQESSFEWLTVRTATGHAGAPVEGGAPRPDGALGGATGGAGADDWQGWSDGAGFPIPGGGPRGTEHGFGNEFEWRETSDESYQRELGRVEWVGPVTRSEWQSGPFSHSVDAPSLLELRETGEVSMRTEDGIVHVVYGPWQVVIRGVGGRAERRVLATWEYRRTIERPGGVERDEAAGHWEPVAPGASEMRFVGASDRRWAGASELLARGGSEMYMVGASERLYGGASERLYRGASERLYRGASERVQRGASERRLGGASERQIAGGAQHQTTGLGASENARRDGGSAAPIADGLPYPRPES